MRAALIILTILFANSALAEWVNLWEEREQLIAECADAPCPELVPVLREIGLLDDALAAQEKVLAADGSVENRLMLAELQVDSWQDEAALDSMGGLAESALTPTQAVKLARLAKPVGNWGLAVGLLKSAKTTLASDAYLLAATLLEMDEWAAAIDVLRSYENLMVEDLTAIESMRERMLDAFAAEDRFPDIEAEQAPLACWLLSLYARQQHGVLGRQTALANLLALRDMDAFQAMLDAQLTAEPSNPRVLERWLRFAANMDNREGTRVTADILRPVDLGLVSADLQRAICRWARATNAELDVPVICQPSDSLVSACQDGRLEDAAEFLRKNMLAWPPLAAEHLEFGRQLKRSGMEHEAARVFWAWWRVGRDGELLARFRQWDELHRSIASGRLLWRGLRWMLRDDEAATVHDDLRRRFPDDAMLGAEAAHIAAEAGRLPQAERLLRELGLRHSALAEGCRELRFEIIREDPDAVAGFCAELVSETANVRFLVSWYERLRKNHYPDLAREVGTVALRIASQLRDAELLERLTPDFEDPICDFREDRGARHRRIVAAAAVAPGEYTAQAALAWHQLAYRQTRDLGAMARAVALRPDAWPLRAKYVDLLRLRNAPNAKAEREALNAQNPHASFVDRTRLSGFDGFDGFEALGRSESVLSQGLTRRTIYGAGYDEAETVSALRLQMLEGQTTQGKAVATMRRHVRLWQNGHDAYFLSDILSRWASTTRCGTRNLPACVIRLGSTRCAASKPRASRSGFPMPP